MKNVLLRKILIFSIFQIFPVYFLGAAGNREPVKVSTNSPHSLPSGANMGANEFGGSKGAEVMRLLKSGKRGEVEDLIHQWMKEEKQSASPWVYAGILKFEEKKYKSCLSYCEKAIDKAPQTAQAYYWRGRAYEELNKYLDAENEYQAALIADPDYAEAKLRLSGVEALLGGAPSGKRNP